MIHFQYNLMVERLPDDSSMSSRQFIQQLQEKMVQKFFNLVRRYVPDQLSGVKRKLFKNVSV